MSMKKELHKISGDENTMELKRQRTLTHKDLYEKYYESGWHKQTWKVKNEPKSNWYPETPDIHVYGIKK